ncbi:MAG TPA: DUF3310 domain-containing protein [Dysgonamonadaceae bacterium]|nr:DUF3310 domain-containing protein [Dysgonamonadaceae bacterium]
MKNRYMIRGNKFGTYEVQDIRTRELLYEGSQEGCELEIDRLETLHKHIRDQMEYFNGDKESNMVDKPNHYIGDLGLEVETVLRNFIPRYEDAYVAHRVASAIEYLLRSPLKNGTQDLEKASYNIQQALEHIKKGELNE